MKKIHSQNSGRESEASILGNDREREFPLTPAGQQLNSEHFRGGVWRASLKSREKEKLLSAGSCYGGDLRRPGPRSQESKEEKIYIFKEEGCLCQLMRQYGLNNMRRSQQKIFLASQIGETPSLDALVTF